jgi:hypothetical protein
MTVRYHNRGTRPVPDYVCQKEGIEHSHRVCQSISGASIDKAIGDLLIQTVTPMALDVALAVQQEIQTRLDEVDRLRGKHIERARYEADLAQRRYMLVDPSNRLVADTLEAEWNSKLHALNEAHHEYERLRQTDHNTIDETQRARIAALVGDFPRLWQDTKTPDREKKRMVRLLVEDVTLLKREQILVHIRFKGGPVQTLSLPLPLPAPLLRKTDKTVIAEVDRLLDIYTEAQIATILNQRGVSSGTGQPFNRIIVRNIRLTYKLRDRFTRLRAAGFITAEEMAECLNIDRDTVKHWRDRGLLRAYHYNDKLQCLYEPPAGDLPLKHKQKKAYLAAKSAITPECTKAGAV